MPLDSFFPVVGIGASAGGLKAIKSFFERMPVDSGMAFIIVTHLPMGRESELPEIVGRYTKISTSVASADQLIEPDHVYVCPPDHILTIDQGHVRSLPQEEFGGGKPEAAGRARDDTCLAVEELHGPAPFGEGTERAGSPAPR